MSRPYARIDAAKRLTRLIARDSVTNPNWFSADFSSITAKAYYPGNSNQFGGGSLSNIKFPGNSGTTFQFPFTLNYTTSMDPSGTILKDLICQ